MNIRKLTLQEAAAIVAELAEGRRHSIESLRASAFALVELTPSYEDAMWARDVIKRSREGFGGAVELRAFLERSFPDGVTTRLKNQIIALHSRAELLRVPLDTAAQIMANEYARTHDEDGNRIEVSNRC